MQAAAEQLRHLCNHERHLHEGRSAHSHTRPSAACGAHYGRRDWRLSSYGHPGGCFMNLAAGADMNRKFPRAELCFIESGGDNLAATFSPELADLTIYVIDVAAGEKIPRKGGPGITRSD